MRATWEQGRYDEVAARLAPAAEVLCDAAEVGSGQRVLDVGAGTGNVALAARARGAEVVSSDLAPAMVEAGRARVGGEWHVADAQALPFPDGAFDVVLSCFGAVFAPDPGRAARELRRAGGVVALTAWTDRSPFGAGHRVIAERLPGAEAHTAALRWRDPGAHLPGAEVTEHRLEWRFEGGLEALLAFIETSAPPFAAARAALADDWPAARAALAEAQREIGEPDGDAWVVRPAYHVVVAR